MYKSIWLFSFISYNYCQGTRDSGKEIRLVSLSLPCEEWEAKMYLIEELKNERVEFDEYSIVSLNINVTNS